MSMVFGNFLRLFARRNIANSAIAASARSAFSSKPVAYEVVDPNENQQINKEIINKVNTQIANKDAGRLFAVVHIVGKQFKITEGDIIIVEGYWPPTSGDKLKLDKVMLVGSKDFTLIGTPLVQDGLVDVHATVVEKTLSHTKTIFQKKRRKQYTNINFHRIQQTMLRINKIELSCKVDNPPEVSGLEHRVL